MNRDHKIDKINAYRKLLESKKLPKISALEDSETHHAVAKELHSEFETWVQGQISQLLGEGSPSNQAFLPFNDQEIEILKTLIAGVQARSKPAQATPKNESNRIPFKPVKPEQLEKSDGSLSEAERARLNSTARPLGNRKMAETVNSSNKDPLVSVLDRMDEEGPQY